MQDPDEQKRRDDLRKLLFDLSKEQGALRDRKLRSSYFLKLEQIYYEPESNEYWRHFYSDILSTLTQIDSDDFGGSLDVLAQNMQVLKDGYQAVNHDDDDVIIDIGKSIIKLYDHTNLEIARINYTKTLNNTVKSDVAKTKMLTSSLQTQIIDAEQKNENNEIEFRNATKKYNEEIEMNQKKMQNEYITILGIFASIVLSFTGGLAFSSSVLNNISSVSIYRLSFIAFVIGLVFFDLIWVLLDFIRDINGKVIRKKWLFIVVNIIMILGMFADCLAYKGHWFLG